jgi:regulator of sigma E protease
MAIVAAGPVANLLFAVAAYWLLAGVGQTVALPKVGAVVPDSPAAVAGLVPGDRITRLGERRVDTWSALHLALIAHGQQAGPIEVTVERADGASRVYVLDPRMVSQEVFAHDPLGALGVSFLPYRPVLSAVLLDGAAARAGLRAGDRLLTVSGQPVRDWAMFAEMIRRHPGQSLRVEVQRGARMLAFTLTPSALTERGRTIGRIGAVPEIDAQALAAAQTYQRLGLIDGLRSALGRTWDTTVLSFRLFGRLLTGELSVRQLSGPVAIADHAGQSAARGWTDYLAFLALVSISIAVLNLLPIPVLDGGHLLYHAAELLRGRPLPDWVRQVGHRVGFGVLMVLTALALFNDLTRLAS